MGTGLSSDESVAGRGWRCIDSGRHSGTFNMNFDLELIGQFGRTGIPVLRFYGWDPFCISLGRNQDSSDINVSLAEDDGVEVVKRPTGGKAVLHADELTYSVVMRTACQSIGESYNLISNALVQGLRLLGADLRLSQSSADFRKLFRDPSTIPCFSTSAFYEVEYRGRKLVGSAQHRFGDILLQHGSILIGDFHKQIVKYLCLSDELKEKTRKGLDEHTVTLREILGSDVDEKGVKAAVARGFEDVLGAEFTHESGSVSAEGQFSGAPAQFENR
ncbi:MAG: lipoate--protein ligase family protein [Bacteroidetes bacterium]|nr:lipoate--protein ligase family protein [Bacteroidota bacterium]